LDALGVDVDHGYAPLYIVPPTRRCTSATQARLKEASALYLRPTKTARGIDFLAPTRPAEAQSAGQAHGLHEITKSAIREAVENCREVDAHLVDAQEAGASSTGSTGTRSARLLWRKIAPRLSAGRVRASPRADRRTEASAWRFVRPPGGTPR